MYMFVEPIPVVKKITYMLTIASAAELKKAAAKRKLKAQNFCLDSDEPWDTFKAQILVKISMAIKPKCLTFGNYTLLFSITCLVPKPGMPVETEADYLFMIEQAIKTKTPMVNITIDENAKEAELDKENEESDQEEGNKKGKKKVSTIATRSYKLLLIHNCHRPTSKKPPVYAAKTFSSCVRSGCARYLSPPAAAPTAMSIPQLSSIFLLVTSIWIPRLWPWYDLKSVDLVITDTTI